MNNTLHVFSWSYFHGLDFLTQLHQECVFFFISMFETFFFKCRGFPCICRIDCSDFWDSCDMFSSCCFFYSGCVFPRCHHPFLSAGQFRYSPQSALCWFWLENNRWNWRWCIGDCSRFSRRRGYIPQGGKSSRSTLNFDRCWSICDSNTSIFVFYYWVWWAAQ